MKKKIKDVIIEKQVSEQIYKKNKVKQENIHDKKQNNRSGAHEIKEKAFPISLCFNRPSKSYLTISINSIYESSNFFSTDLIQAAIHSGPYFKAISLPPSL